MSFQSILLGLAAGSLLMIQPVLACDNSGCQQSCSSTESMPASSRQVMTAKAGTASECQQSCSSTESMPVASRQVMTASLMAQSPNIVEIAVSNDDFSTLVAAVKSAGLVEALSAEGPVTVFAPTNEAFGRIDKDTIAFLLTDQGRPQLERILLHHVVPGRLEASDLVGKTEVETLAGTTLSLELARDRLFVDKALVQSADIGASNGVIHVIDRVMLPPVQVSPVEMLLTNAIELGVPMFNNNNAEGCAAVYATALDAIASVDGFGLNSQARGRLSKQLMSIADMRDASERAWAYRRIMDSMLNGQMQM